MKVLLLDVEYKHSSTGKIVSDIYTALQNRGIETAVCYGRGKKSKDKNVYKFGLDFETYGHALLTRLTGYNGCFSLFSTIRLLRFLDKFQPDIIHIHELHAYFLNYGMLFNYLHKKKIKIVWTHHSCWAFTGHCAHFDYVGCDKWKTQCKKCVNLHEYPSSLFFDRSKKQFKKKKKLFTSIDIDKMIIVSPSKWLTDLLGESFFSKYKITTDRKSVV